MKSLRLVSFDIDGTLTLGHGWFYIASELGRLDRFMSSSDAFGRGDIGEDEHLANLLNIAAGVRSERVVHALKRTQRIDNIGDGLERLKRAGLRTYLLTHNPSYVCRWYVKEFGFDGYRGAAQQVRNGKICRTTGRADKVECMRLICNKERVSPEALVHVGDGESDASVFKLAGHGIAVNSRSRVAIRASTISLNTTDMNEIVDAVLDLPL